LKARLVDGGLEDRMDDMVGDLNGEVKLRPVVRRALGES